MSNFISYYFDLFEHYMNYLVPDWFINGTLRLVFSKTSVILHTVWFVIWFGEHLDVSLLTNIVSLEAIYIGILIGIQQLKHHIVLHGKVHADGTVKAVVKEIKK